jgi:Flp pilus assembly CpaE family ATPase
MAATLAAPGARAPARTPRPAAPAKRGTTARARGGGTLLAVCGVCPGAGASYLSYLVALAAVRRPRGDVLVCDTGGPSGALARYSGVHAPYSLVELADRVAKGTQLGRVFADGRDGLRVLASTPRVDPPDPPPPLAELLGQARAAHALTVIDCGALTTAADRIALEHCDRVAWVLPASAIGLERARHALLAARRVPTPRELLIARAEPEPEATPQRCLRRLAGERAAPLIFVPWLPPRTAERPSAALEAAQVSLQAILGTLQR